MIGVIREEYTEYLFAGLLEKELKCHRFRRNATIAIEPKAGAEFYFSQDYGFNTVEKPCKFAFYALPHLENEIKKQVGNNCALVTYAADPRLHKPKKLKKIYDLVFIGKEYYDERRNYIKVLTDKYPRSFLNQGTRQTIPGQLIPKLLSQGKILFNHTRDVIDVNLRFFEAMALGCQVMVRNKWLGQFATEGVHYMAYSSPEELLAVVDKLLKNDDLREYIAFNARKHFLEHHTYGHRVQTIINHITEYYANNRNRQ